MAKSLFWGSLEWGIPKIMGFNTKFVIDDLKVLQSEESPIFNDHVMICSYIAIFIHYNPHDIQEIFPYIPIKSSISGGLN